MGAGNLYARCARCANRCRIRLTIGDEGTVVEARKQVPGRMTTYEQCPNLDKDVGLPVACLKTEGLIGQ